MVAYDTGDSFISDDEEEFCPLCVEEMDISDKNFKPCPCGYQVCQFCYNNIRQNPQLNGCCPACRRLYDDDSVEYRVISQEEWRKDHEKQARKERERKQRQREKKESEQLSRKHLSGMRVIQKNLVYVIGLTPTTPLDDLHNTLRGESFFGQYGKIQKIVINKRSNSSSGSTNGIGVYVTFARKEDAARCIAAVDGSLNEGKYLRAAYGTTKYCSSYLRGQTCPNPNCMFLHEPGEEADSYSRQDLSTYQVSSGGKSNTAEGSPGSGSLPPATIASTTTTTTTSSSTNTPATAGITNKGPPSSDNANYHLPPTVSWANKASPQITQAKIHTSSLSSYPPLPMAVSTSQEKVVRTQSPEKSYEAKTEKSKSRSASPTSIHETEPLSPPQQPKEPEEAFVPTPEQRLPDLAVTYMHNTLEVLARPENFTSYNISEELESNVGTSLPFFSFVKTDDDVTSEEKSSKNSEDDEKTDEQKTNDAADNFSEYLFKPCPLAWGFRAQIEVIDVARDPALQIQAAMATVQAQAVQAAAQIAQQQQLQLQIQQQTAIQQQLQQQQALIQQQLLQQQRQQQHQNAINNFTLDPTKTSTPPPPGLYAQGQTSQQSQGQQPFSPMISNSFVQSAQNQGGNSAVASPIMGGAAGIQNLQNMQFQNISMFQQQQQNLMALQQQQQAQSPSQANSGELLARLIGKRDVKGMA